MFNANGSDTELALSTADPDLHDLNMDLDTGSVQSPWDTVQTIAAPVWMSNSSGPPI